MNKIALMVCASLASGCSTFPMLKQNANSPIASYVAPEISLSDSEKIAKDMAAFLSMQLPPAKTTIAVSPAPTLFHEMLFDELAWRGFGVVEYAEEDAVSLRYFLTPLDQGVLVRMRFNDSAASWFYSRTSNALSIGSAFAVRGDRK